MSEEGKCTFEAQKRKAVHRTLLSGGSPCASATRRESRDLRVWPRENGSSRKRPTVARGAAGRHGGARAVDCSMEFCKRRCRTPHLEEPAGFTAQG